MVIPRGVSLEEAVSQIDRAARALETSHAFIQYDSDAMERAAVAMRDRPGGPLSGMAVSVKDLMDAEGWPTTHGGRRPCAPQPPARRDASFVSAWRDAGAWIVGKTHLNEQAYGLTGENPWWGDCTVPGQPGRLTGGSSSGAAASVLGGAADVGLGTDTGGSLRVPASLCGLASLRAPGWFPSHDGVRPLARTFDTLGWIGRDACELESVAEALMGRWSVRFATPRVVVLDGPLLDACDEDARRIWRGLEPALAAAGVSFELIDVGWLEGAAKVFPPLQAREAWRFHRAQWEMDPEAFGGAVRQRLEWGASLGDADERALRRDAAAFRRRMNRWLGCGGVLALPACAVTRLETGADHGPVRSRILSLTTPASVARLPVVTQPCPWADPGRPLGIQWVGPSGGEWMLLRWASWLARAWAEKQLGQSGYNEPAATEAPGATQPCDLRAWNA